MAQEMDAGDIIIQKELPVEPSDTTGTLLARCAELSASLIVQALKTVETGSITATPQNHTAATYCTLLGKYAPIPRGREPLPIGWVQNFLLYRRIRIRGTQRWNLPKRRDWYSALINGKAYWYKQARVF